MIICYCLFLMKHLACGQWIILKHLTAQARLRTFCSGTSANEEVNLQKGEMCTCGYTLSAKFASTVQLCIEI